MCIFDKIDCVCKYTIDIWNMGQEGKSLGIGG